MCTCDALSDVRMTITVYPVEVEEREGAMDVVDLAQRWLQGVYVCQCIFGYLLNP